MDILKSVVEKYLELQKSEYRIILSAGRNKPLEIINLNFTDEDIYHILGLQHIGDLEIPKNKKRVLDAIVSGNITDEYLSQSEYYDNDTLGYSIRNRICHAEYLEEYLDSDDFSVSIYKLQHENVTMIDADYLIECRRLGTDKDYYIFLRKRKETPYYGIISCFPKNRITYWGGKRYLMLKEKTTGDSRKELFRHPNYEQP